MSSGLSQKTCRSCGIELTHLQLFQGETCDKIACRGPSLQKQHWDAKVKRREQRLQIAEQAIRLLGRNLENTAAVSVVPWCGQDLAVIPDERIQEFREHLQRELEKAAKDWSPSQESSENHVLSDEQYDSNTGLSSGDACATCRGSCCKTGDTHAYVDHTCLQRYWSKHPDLTVDEVYSTYLQHLPALSIKGSCVYHAIDGCQLSRSMRSITCNDFRCEGLNDFLDSLVEINISPRTIVATNDKGEIKRIVEVATDGKRNEVFEGSS